MMEAQCAVAETAIHGAEPGLAEVKKLLHGLSREQEKQIITQSQ